MARRCVTTACLAALIASLGAGVAGGAPATLAVSFDSGARLGAPAAVTLELKINPREAPSPVTEVGILSPAGVDVTSSGLGLATCRRPQSAFEQVLVIGESPSCPPNAVLATGLAWAEVRLGNDLTIPASGIVTLMAGSPQEDHPGLVAYVVAQHPVRAQLLYAGLLFSAPPPFGIGMRLVVRPIPHPPLDATVALVRMRIRIGSRGIVYYRHAHGRRVPYRPGGIPLPRRCPHGGFRFRALLRFADGSRTTTDARLRCPRRAPRA